MDQTEPKAPFTRPATDEAFCVFDPDGKLLDANQRACEALGFTRDQLLQLNLKDVELTFGPDGLGRFFDQVRPAELLKLKAMPRRSDGTLFAAEMHLVFFEAVQRKLMLLLFREMIDWDAETGTETTTATLDAMAGLAGDITHQLNNELTLIQVNASTLLAESRLNPDTAQSAQDIYSAVNRAANLTGQLAALWRKRS